MSSSIDAETGKRPVIRINVSDPTLLLIPACASTLGFVSGLLQSGQKASLQFLAENAHRQPSTLQGWYFYNKTKNYRVALAAARGGSLTAIKLGAWTGAFVGIKEYATLFGYNNTQGGAMSGLSLALGATYFYSLPRRALPRNLLLAVSLGGLAGVMQDARNWLAIHRASVRD